MSVAIAIAAPARHSLFDYLDDVDAIATTLESLADDETSDEARADLERMLADALAGTRAKIDRTSGIIVAFETAAAAAKAERDRCSARAKRFESQINAIESRVLSIMAANGLKKLEGNVSTLAARSNPVSVVIDDVDEIPSTLMRSLPIPADVPDKKLIAENWRRGVAVPGTHIEQNSRLTRS